MAKLLDPTEPRHLINRELTWLAFNERVLGEAEDPSVPLLERLKFLAIFSSNLDEFFMIRVANLREAEAAGVMLKSADGMTPVEQLEAIAARTQELVRRQYVCLHDDVLPSLAKEGIGIEKISDLKNSERKKLREQFDAEIFPVLTPLTADPSHPFPYIANDTLNLFVQFEQPTDTEELHFAIVEIPHVLKRLIAVGSPHEHRWVLLGDLIATFADTLFDGLTITGTWTLRVTRDSDLSLEDRDLSDLLQDIERELRSRVHRRIVRLEVEHRMPDGLVQTLRRLLDVPVRDTYRIDGILHVPSLMHLLKSNAPHLKDHPFNPRLAPRLASNDDIFAIIRESDLLLHHPYETFSTTMELIQAAASDEQVLAIKLTLYRTSGDADIIRSLIDAAAVGKQVAVVVELKARFDERRNIEWARELERAGCHVVYGFVGLKTHAKALMLVRRDDDKKIRRYVHLSTGNYNSATAGLYSDVAVMTCDPIIGDDITRLFNLLTGCTSRTIAAMMRGEQPVPTFQKVHVAPFDLAARLLHLIEQEIEFHKSGEQGLIRAQVNSLSNAKICRALYRASQAGVRIELVVRGICCLRPGVAGLSDNIRVVSVVDRFLEHPRIYHFRHGGADLVYMASADLMGRNLFRRIEIMFPIESPPLRERILNEILMIPLQDNVKARELRADGTYHRVTPQAGVARVRTQEHFIALARRAGVKAAPYKESLKEPRKRNKRQRKKS